MATFPIYMNNQQNDGSRWLYMYCSQCMPSLFSYLIDAVKTNKAVFTFEYQSR